ncbi:low temperature requirement protein A [Bradyrhizobium sp. LHD-71]|uniref:low temperature requirement protein A n=1 Tax=Bradyrhizobium sp. LHD-71 TaxID=3072141 RepID=UPI00280DB1C1|nr:low temperature requirement protein A [Bradyrhizobium sp. LHD-71]MDQ8731795.1 low temperature requirement protein A [Bradyrhizobium sp. LHD-71]
MTTRATLMRERAAGGHHRVTYVELFFDLVFVFAVTQISHTLLEHFTPLGVIEVAVLFLAVWWVWIFTSWITNWLDPERTPVRIGLFVLMLAGLVLSTSIPKAFEERGLAFGIAFAAMQVGRTLFMYLSVPDTQPALKCNFLRILVWLSASGVLWIAGGFAHGENRLLLWGLALAIEYVSPAAGFWTPGLGRSSAQDWTVEGGHMAERCALFIIIALGESILVTGATFSKLTWTPEAVGAFLVAFVGSLAMWWIYFHKGAEAGAHSISHAQNPGRVARLAYTYLHMPIVAGIVMVAVGDELVLAHPSGHSDVKAVMSLVGGPLLFLVGVILFKRTIHGRLQLSHLVGIAALIVVAPVGRLLSPLILSSVTTAILLIVAVWEAISIGDKRTLEVTSEIRP